MRRSSAHSAGTSSATGSARQAGLLGGRRRQRCLGGGRRGRLGLTVLRRCHLAGGHLLLAGFDAVRNRADDEAARADGVVVPGDDVVGVVGVAVRVHERRRREGRAGEPRGSRAAPSSGRRRRSRREGASCRPRPRGSSRASRARPPWSCAPWRGSSSSWPSSRRRRSSCMRSSRSEIVLQFVRRPPSQRWFTYGMPTRSASSAMESWDCFFVPTKRTEPPRSATLRTNACACFDETERLLQVDDVDAAALREDVAAHLGVPAARLVAEMDSGLQELAHGDDGQADPPRLNFAAAGGNGWNRDTPGTATRDAPPGRVTKTAAF